MLAACSTHQKDYFKALTLLGTRQKELNKLVVFLENHVAGQYHRKQSESPELPLGP
jgi:hypothetical protein